MEIQIELSGKVAASDLIVRQSEFINEQKEKIDKLVEALDNIAKGICDKEINELKPFENDGEKDGMMTMLTHLQIKFLPNMIKALKQAKEEYYYDSLEALSEEDLRSNDETQT